MSNFIIYRLVFRSPLRIGERGVGLEVTRPYVPADTLFSAICSIWRELYGADNLAKEVLNRYPREAPANGSEPFFITSAFPFAGAVRFFPKPLARLQRLTVPENHAKAYKRLQFVSEAIFAKLIAGATLTFDKTWCCNHGSVWFDGAKPPDNEKSQEERAFNNFWEAEQDSYEFWRTQVRPRVRLDRITSASDIWHIGSVHFRSGCGLWFAADFSATIDSSFRNKFEACLRLLGDTGLGGERGGGYGLFEFRDAAELLPNAANANAFLTLAPFRPGDAPELARLTRGDPFYEIITRRGWIGSREGSTLRRKTVWMFSEGSVFSDSGSPRPGALVEVTPEIWEGGQPHAVFRYGLAFPIGFNMEN